MKKLLNFLTKAANVAESLNKNPHLPKALGGAKNIRIDQVPASTEAFIQLRDKIANTPEGGAALLVLAAIKFSQDAVMGRHWVIIATDKTWLSPSNAERAYRGVDLGGSADFSLKQLEGKDYIPYSYIKGTSTANGYQPGNTPYQISIERTTDGGDGTVKVYVLSSGVDTARPITMKKNDAGVWKGVEYSSIFTGVKPPVAKSGGASEGDF